MKNIRSQKRKKMKRARQELFWHFASLWLEGLNFMEICDDGFKDLYNKLCSYVSTKIDSDIDGEITDMYVIVEHKTEK